ncbi:NAD-dependent epimerase/dehydratase family protein [Kitasatospora viridis]|uniref:Nucleoside-diphosphate-sugar epimerase n=1 Tax=Kitasatospora viridis TaxID=281105 RepID=A0A561UGV5_9ACTN|nr:NAD-dependent epimerase/dehydratase family protein [Kitasatospora viridis]TWF98586.1 nucleoside-diphosphate-sugar epimerase [Kitasatospora viridis]
MKVLVTGGSGFLGLEICRQLIARGSQTVSISRRPSAELANLGVRQYQVDITDTADLALLSRAAAGCEAVVHSAALAGASGPLRPYWRANVTGTLNVIAACRVQSVPALVHTSTASVVFRPGGLEGVNEDLPYPRRHLAAYTRTKAEAEALVLAAHSPKLATLALRPHIIWGPGDPHFAPALARAVRAGHLLMPGEGNNLIDTTHVRTAAHAHLLALDALQQPRQAGGRVYFIGQDDPRPLREITLRLLQAAGINARWRTVPPRLATATATVGEAYLRLTRSRRTHALSRLLVAEMLHPHHFDLTAARRDLRFEPPIGFDDGLDELTRTAPPALDNSKESPCRKPTTPSVPS